MVTTIITTVGERLLVVGKTAWTTYAFLLLLQQVSKEQGPVYLSLNIIYAKVRVRQEI